MITTHWTTVATVGYSHGVSRRNENRAAHGGVCHLQVRSVANGILGRKVNVNGRHAEQGEAFELDAYTLAQWKAISKASR